MLATMPARSVSLKATEGPFVTHNMKLWFAAAAAAGILTMVPWMNTAAMPFVVNAATGWIPATGNIAMMLIIPFAAMSLWGLLLASAIRAAIWMVMSLHARLR
jgi:hypothetical protein